MNFSICFQGDLAQIPFLPKIASLNVGLELQSFGLKGVKSQEAWDVRLAQHRPVGKGNINFSPIFQALAAFAPEATLSLEAQVDMETKVNNLEFLMHNGPAAAVPPVNKGDHV